MRRAAAIALLVGAGCDVPAAPAGTGGVDLEGGAADVRGFLVVGQPEDFRSTNVSVLDGDGELLTATLASTATLPLGGDVVLPSMPAPGAEAVLVDRGSPSSAPQLLFVDLETAAARRLDVSTGFWSNPRDYAQVAPDKAYVSRYNSNRGAGEQSHDMGADLLVVDPRGPAVTGRIDLTPALEGAPGGIESRPDRMAVLPGRVAVVLGMLPATFEATTPSRLAFIDPTADEVTGFLDLAPLTGCTSLLSSPSGTRLVVLCLGRYSNSSGFTGEGAGMALVEIDPAPRVDRTIDARALGGGAPSFHGDFAAEDELLVVQFGSDEGESAVADRLVSIDLATTRSSELLRSGELPYTLGGVSCAARRGLCLVADAGRGVVHRFRGVTGAGTPTVDTVQPDPRTGIPPRELGRL
ncbi:MAG: hypothetical protein FJ104_03385 [Deltaproteobacteria bacterium]|nr:hypothetical protein [Deltaproteobacteria bacterium]